MGNVLVTWDAYFLNIAKEVSKRSKDAQTKHGCVLVDAQHHIVGTGYNSFPVGLPDSELPNVRPGKYDWILHSEQNALLHRIGNPTTAYITGRPCLHCLMSMYSVGVRRIVSSAEYGWSKSDEEETNFNRMLAMGGIEYCVFLQAPKEETSRPIIKAPTPYVNDDGFIIFQDPFDPNRRVMYKSEEIRDKVVDDLSSCMFDEAKPGEDIMSELLQSEPYKNAPEYFDGGTVAYRKFKAAQE